MPKIRVKICGITNNDDALLATAAGADALGLVFYEPSPRAVQLPQVEAILANVPAGVQRVALFVDAEREQVSETADSGNFSLLQFHGDEPPDYCESFSLPYLKALKVPVETCTDSAARAALLAHVERQARRYQSADMILLDSSVGGRSGGTGQRFDWSLLQELSPQLKDRLLLAGGLSPENVAEALLEVAPFGVDVSSGVEARPGKKNPASLEAFFRQLKPRT